MTKAVIFDVGGVLIDWNPKYLYSKLLADEAAIEAYLDEIGFNTWNLALDEGGRWEPAIAELVAKFPHHKDLIEAAHLRWHEMLGGDIPGTVAILKRLADAGVPLYAITNYSSEKFIETVERFPFFALFRDIVVSGDEKLLKPEAAIFRMCLDRNGLKAQDCVFIDDVARNIDGACAVGIDAILFESPEQLERDLKARGLLP
jgi:epoxide hydrolase-like predicted phosphatase